VLALTFNTDNDTTALEQFRRLLANSQCSCNCDTTNIENGVTKFQVDFEDPDFDNLNFEYADVVDDEE
jgi:hypothetical protein